MEKIEILLVLYIVIKLIRIAVNAKQGQVNVKNKKKLKCNSCGKEFDESEVNEWLDDNDEEDDDFGCNPCCPYCGSSDVEE